MKHLLLSINLFCVISLFSEPLTLSDCFSLALNYNPKQLSSYYNAKSAKEESLIKKAPYYPEFFASAHAYRWQTHNFLEIAVPPPLPPDIVPSLVGPTWDFGYLFMGRYTLYDFGEAKERYLAARAQYKSASFERERIKEEILLNVAFNFFQLASNIELVGVALKNLERTDSHLHFVQEKRDVGTAPLSDILRSKVDVAEAKLTLVRAETQVEISEAKLREALGLEWDCPLEIDAKRSVHIKPTPEEIPKARYQAFYNRPELKALTKKIEAHCHHVESVKSSNWPKVTALGAWGQRDTEIPPVDQEWLFGLRMEMPLFTGFRLTHEEGKARSEMNEAKADYETLCLSVDQEIMTAYSKLKEAYELINTTKVQVEDARESMRLTAERYKAGVSTLTDLLDAQTSLLRSEATRVNAEWNFEAATSYFLWTQGLLSASFCN